MAQVFVPSPYIGAPCAILDVCEDGSMGDLVTIVETNPHGIVPKVYLIGLDTLNALVNSINETYRNTQY
ncbi:hypothetical protein JZU46_06590 [bacterium]|nr:hypothetical protein [bacterium]